MPAPKGNKYAEKYNLEDTQELFRNILVLLEEDKEILAENYLKVVAKRKLGLSMSTYEYLLDTKFVKDGKNDEVLATLKKEIDAILEYRAMTTKKMYPGIAAMTLKNKHGWKDKSEVDQNIKGELSLSSIITNAKQPRLGTNEEMDK